MKNPILTLFGVQTALMAALLAVNVYSADRLNKLERQYQPPDDRTLSSVDDKLKCMAITLQWIKTNTDAAEELLSKIAYPSLPGSTNLHRSLPPSPC
jgi:hypothetical protein